MKKTIGILFIILLTHFAVFAQLQVENKTAQTLRLAAAYYLENDKEQCYHTQGWFELKPNEKIVLLKDKLQHRYYYFYAEKIPSGAKIEGDGTFKYAVSNTQASFDLKDADSPAANATAPFYKFVQVDIGDNETFTYSLVD
ncbi:MAG: DUF1036 domain-containing protein [Cytophagales bacterium]|nr:MAG: DUF1036 domain-containing protein [Cytophagales bacterium]TAF60862.1 MAG: DUF1036 domain-containing protein [Cytophagales bacterium]